MKCKECNAFGIDHLGFRGCLIEHAMEDLPDGSVGCRRHKNTIDKEIAAVKAANPRAKGYRRLHEKKD